MVLLTGNWLLDGTCIVIATATILIFWLKYSHGYWQRRGISTLPATLPFGNSKTVLTQEESFADFTNRLYKYFKYYNKPHGGIYLIHTPVYVPVNLDIIKNILQNDFNHFVDRGVYSNEEVDPLSAHLFSLEGGKWRNLRAKLTPTFTSGKLKMMFETLVNCGDQLVIAMDKAVGQSLDIKDILTRFTTDIIGNCAFGIDCNSMKNPNNEFTQNFKAFFVDGFWENIIGFITFIAPDLSRKLNIKITKPHLATFFMKIVKDTIEYRESNNIYRKDFMHLLLQLKNRGRLVDDGSIKNEEKTKQEITLTTNEIAAQAFVFFLAGYETSSTTMTFCLFELASNPEIQDKLRQEIEEVLKKHDNKITYEAIMEMHYMEKVVNETLRKYPPLPQLNRICTKAYKVPGTDFTIEKGIRIMIPIMGIHHDPDFYPEPSKFDPERFADDNKKNRHPCSFLPFGEGPRVCIGLRFGMIQTKVGLSFLVKHYKFSVNPKTQLPITLDPRSFTLNTEGGIWLDYTKI